MVAKAPYANMVGSHAGLAGTRKTAAFLVNFDEDPVVINTDHVIGSLPGHVLVIGGQLVTTDLDTGDETLELDFGWAANGAGQNDGHTDPGGVIWENAGYQASQTGFVNSGVLDGDAVATLPVLGGGNWRPVFLPKPLYFKRETPVVMHVEAIAAGQAAGVATLYVDYIVP